MSRSEEDWGSSRTPASISQILCVRTMNKDDKNIFLERMHLLTLSTWLRSLWYLHSIFSHTSLQQSGNSKKHFIIFGKQQFFLPLESKGFSEAHRLDQSEPGRYQQFSQLESWPSCCRQTHFLAQSPPWTWLVLLAHIQDRWLPAPERKTFLSNSLKIFLWNSLKYFVTTEWLWEWIIFSHYMLGWTLLFLQFWIQNKLLNRSCKLSDIPPHHLT